MSHQRTVYLIEADANERRLLSIQLSHCGAEAWPFASAAEFLEMLDHLPPASILVAMEMPETSGLELLGELVARDVDWPVIALSGAQNLRTAVAAMKLGALDFLARPVDSELLGPALAFAFSTLERMDEAREARLHACERARRLTPRELEIAGALLSGQANKSAAHQLGISVRTVEMHRANIMSKLGAKSLAEAAVLLTHAGAGTRPPLPVERRRAALLSWFEAEGARPRLRLPPVGRIGGMAAFRGS